MGLISRMEQIKNLLKSEPDDTFLLFALAKEYEKLENWQPAILYYEKINSIDSNYLAYYYHYGKLLERLDRNEEAIKIYQSGINKCLDSNDLHSKAELQTALQNLQIQDLL